jgi:hypothetical protein
MAKSTKGVYLMRHLLESSWALREEFKERALSKEAEVWAKLA